MVHCDHTNLGNMDIMFLFASYQSINILKILRNPETNEPLPLI